MSDLINLISRVLLSAVFIVYGSLKFIDVSNILVYPGTRRFMDLVAGGAPTPTWLGYLIATFEVGAGLAILFGIKTRWAAWALVAYLILATYLGHAFWLMDGAPRVLNMSHFHKNLAIIAGFLLLASVGGGRFSVDGRTRSA